MKIKRYDKTDEAALFDMFIEEGEDWSEYYTKRAQYAKALESGVTYVACENDVLCGYVRCREDDGFGVYVYDLLVRKAYRGRQMGRLLMEQICRNFPAQPVYVMSDVDPYYQKLGYPKEGSVFQVIPKAGQLKE